MAPIEPDFYNDNTRPLAILGAYVTLTAFLIALIGHRVLYRSYRALSPSVSTRQRKSQRTKHLVTVAGLAALSLAFATYYLVSIATVSYQVWAYERGDPVPTSFFGDNGIFNEDGSLALQLGRWFQDTDVLADSWEIALSNSRRQWWAQQLFLGRSAWSLYASIDSRRRNIPHLWAFILLVTLTSLAFAQNLYALAVLLTPVPLSSAERHSDLLQRPSSSRSKHSRKSSRAIQETAAATESATTSIPHRIGAFFDRIVPPKPADWTPHPLVYSVPLLLSVISIVLTGIASNTPSFQPFVFYTFIALFTPPVIVRLSPSRFGTTGSSARMAGDRALNAFRVISLLSLPLHFSRSVIAILDNDESRHRHYYFFRDNKSMLQHAGSSIGRVLGAFADHPACGRIAWDVILSGLTLLVWAGMRGIHGGEMLRAAGLASRREIELVEDVTGYVKREVKRAAEELNGNGPDTPTVSKPRKRRGTDVRKSSGAQATEAETGETGEMAKAYQADSGQGPWVGDEERSEEWEISALAWGTLVLGGLGVESASVLGAELV